MNREQIVLIHDLIAATEARGFPIWLENGWAVDARLGMITREHDDLDLAIPAENLAEFQKILRERGASDFETTEYGFLTRVHGVLLDCEPCFLVEGAYELLGVARGSCPWEKEGVLLGVPVRCASWESTLWDYFFYLEEVPYAAWPSKVQESYQVVRTAVGEAQADAWHAEFSRRGEWVGGVYSVESD